MIPSKATNTEGSTSNTHSIEIRAPLDINVHNELIISMLEYMPTPNVEAKNASALTMTDFALSLTASVTAFLTGTPAVRLRLYFVVIRIA